MKSRAFSISFDAAPDGMYHVALCNTIDIFFDLGDLITGGIIHMLDCWHAWHQLLKVCRFISRILGCQNDDDFRTKNTSPKQSLKASFVSFMIGDRCCFMDVFF